MTVRDWSEAHFRMVAVRVLELAALLLVAVAALEMWVGWSGPVFSDGAGGGSPPFDFRVWSVTMALFRGPIGLVVAAVLLGLCLAVIHRLRPVAHAGVLRWEVGAVAVAGLLVEVVALVAVGLAFVTPLPFGGGSEKAFYLANAVGLTLAGTLPLVLVALWWWRLLGEPDPESDAAGAVESDADEVGGRLHAAPCPPPGVLSGRRAGPRTWGRGPTLPSTAFSAPTRQGSSASSPSAATRRSIRCRPTGRRRTATTTTSAAARREGLPARPRGRVGAPGAGAAACLGTRARNHLPDVCGAGSCPILPVVRSGWSSLLSQTPHEVSRGAPGVMRVRPSR